MFRFEKILTVLAMLFMISGLTSVFSAVLSIACNTSKIMFISAVISVSSLILFFIVLGVGFLVEHIEEKKSRGK